MVNNGVGVTVGTTYTAAGAAFTPTVNELTHGTGTRIAHPFVMATNDLLRIKFKVYSRGPLAHGGNALLPSAVDFEWPVWLIWPQWCLEPTLAVWAAIPNQVDYGPADGLHYTSESQGAMVLPHGTPTLDNARTGTDWFLTDFWSAVRSVNILNTGATYTVYGLRLVIAGLFYPSPDAGGNEFVFNTAWNDDTVKIGGCQMLAVQQRTR